MPLNPPCKQAFAPGTLYVVSTPIGNLSDMTFRGVEILKAVSLIAAEDTRNTARLLSAFDIHTPMTSCHEHNEERCAQTIAVRLLAGDSVALVSDAGTPSVSDPGFRVMTAALKQGVKVVPVPGASAAVAALCASGLPSDQFCFLGFSPKKKSKRKEMLNNAAERIETLIFYESARRIVAFLGEIFEIMGDRRVVVAREMTKLHEEFIRGRISDVIRELAGRDSIKGEITLLVSGAEKKSGEITPEILAGIKDELKGGKFGASDIAKRFSKIYDVPKNRIYSLVMDMKDTDLKSKMRRRDKDG
ncbi:MAG: 16S rRNA (cytidine(1402)-2'-O)-methyltransferase [Deltaproteobacteria bacterium]|nr:16S rRNA (cytidine(1402)-2'-O)-methyltransferase [Deltaproteobacteria bacterium]